MLHLPLALRYLDVINKKQKLIFALVAITAFFTFLSWSEFNFFADADKDGSIDSFDNCPTSQISDNSDVLNRKCYIYEGQNLVEIN